MIRTREEIQEKILINIEHKILVKAVKVATGQYDVAYDFYASKEPSSPKMIYWG